MRGLWPLFVYASLGFVLVFVYRFDYLRLPALLAPAPLVFAVVALLGGFVLEAAGWRSMLARDGAPASMSIAIAASGRSILGKYIPGKLWMIVGRASWAARALGRPVARLALVTLNAQVLALWAALLLGLPGMAWVGGLRIWGSLWLLLMLVFSCVLFSRVVHRRVETWLGGRWPALGERLPHVEIATARVAAPWMIAGWLALGAGFAALASSVVPAEARASVPAIVLCLGFPLASALGMAAVFVPGGLGVREGVLTGYLVLAGMSVEWATSLAVASRIWFLAGELAWFAIGHVTGRDVVAPAEH